MFSYVGYGLINGAPLAGFNAETPPLGKYLIGLSIVIFRNPAYYALFFGIASLILYSFIARVILKDKLFYIFAPLLLYSIYNSYNSYAIF